MAAGFQRNDTLKKQTAVAPAQAGAHHVFQSRTISAIGSSLLWSDDVVAVRLFADEGGVQAPTPSLPRRNPSIDLLFEHIQRNRSRFQHRVVEPAYVEFLA